MIRTENSYWQSIHNATKEHYEKTFSKIFPKKTNFNRLATELLSEEKALLELTSLQKILSTSLTNKKVLEIGSGHGMVVCMGIKSFSAKMHGIEPGEQFEGSFATSIDVCKHYDIDPSCITRGIGEELPYPDNYFDVVYSSNVLEHVGDPAKVLAQSIRVCNSSGYIVCIVPNYGSFWEGHYGFFFPPYSPKWLLKLIARVLGRDPKFIDSLQLVTYSKLNQWLKSFIKDIEIVSFGAELFNERLRTLEIPKWALLSSVAFIVKLLKALKLTELVILFSSWFHWETPFVLVIKKK